jgi:hypothetical protein
MNFNELKNNPIFLRKGASLRGDKWMLEDGAPWRKFEPIDVTKVVSRLIQSGKIEKRKTHPNAVKNGYPPITAHFSATSGLFFLIEPMCHGNGGWCGQSILQVGTKAELLAICPNERGWSGNHGPYAYDPEPRICTEPDVSKSIIIWDGEELTWKNRKTDEVISQFSSNTAYKSVAIN